MLQLEAANQEWEGAYAQVDMEAMEDQASARQGLTFAQVAQKKFGEGAEFREVLAEA